MYIKKSFFYILHFSQSGLKKIGYHLEARKNDAKEGNGKREAAISIGKEIRQKKKKYVQSNTKGKHCKNKFS